MLALPTQPQQGPRSNLCLSLPLLGSQGLLLPRFKGEQLRGASSLHAAAQPSREPAPLAAGASASSGGPSRQQLRAE